MGQGKLDRAAAERVLRRAVQLGDEAGAPEDSFEVEVLLEAAADLGVSGSAVHRALAEEQAGLLSGDRGRLDALVGPASISVARVVPVSAAQAMHLTDEWLRRQWAFRRIRAGDTVAQYRRRTDMVASMQRTARSMSGKENAEKVRNLRLVVRELPRSTHTSNHEVSIVAVVVDLEASRSFAEMGAGAVAGGGTLLSAIPAFGQGIWVSLLGIPASFAMGAGVLVARRAWTGGIDEALEGLLDRVESGEAPPSVLGGITGRFLGGGEGRG
ncbi:MAG: hypothetical protein M9942_07355 [Microthrixaceae bacterium]|nr:hypothetical protein [Microthrixaceae bacterium]MCO5318241.1 hypothetical protein [Microthrixaceae bacterium]